MSSQLLGLVIGVIGCILFVGVAVGLPALAVTAIKFFKYKERELRSLSTIVRHRLNQFTDLLEWSGHLRSRDRSALPRRAAWAC